MLNDDEWVFALLAAVGSLLLVALICLPVRQVYHHYEVKQCHQFSEQAGYTTKFVDYNFFSWDCLAQTKTGKWVGYEKLRDVD